MTAATMTMTMMVMIILVSVEAPCHSIKTIWLNRNKGWGYGTLLSRLVSVYVVRMASSLCMVLRRKNTTETHLAIVNENVPESKSQKVVQLNLSSLFLSFSPLNSPACVSPFNRERHRDPDQHFRHQLWPRVRHWDGGSHVDPMAVIGRRAEKRIEHKWKRWIHSGFTLH